MDIDDDGGDGCAPAPPPHRHTQKRAHIHAVAMNKQSWSSVSAFLIIFVVLLVHNAEGKDLYGILGVEKNASQREVQKAFHRLSLKYHPDKNPSKSAQAKFAEINNAYEVLSDEEKRKNYDLFGDEQGRARGPEPNAHNGGYGSFHGTNKGHNSQRWSHFKYTPNENSGGHRFEQQSYGFGGDDGSHGQRSFFNFPFGDDFAWQERMSSFGFGGNKSPDKNIFEILFGSTGSKPGEGQGFASYNDGRTTSSKERSFQGAAKSATVSEELTPKTFQNKVLDQLYTWAILFTPHASNEVRGRLQLLEQISTGLRGTIKVGFFDCAKYGEFCKKHKMWPLKTMKLRLYSLRRNGKLSALDYSGEWTAADVRTYCTDALPRLSKHLDGVDSLNNEISAEDSNPVAVLLTKKKEAPAIWRALSGLFYGRIVFFDVQIHKDAVDAAARRFEVDSFPSIIGVYTNGETYVLRSGTTLENVGSSIEELKGLLEDLERDSKASGPRKSKEKAHGEVISLTKENFGHVCSQNAPLCVIGVHKSSKGKDKLKQILKEVSQKSLIRKGHSVSSSIKPVSYSVLDATKQPAFLNAFDKSLLKSENMLLIAYKPKKGTYISYDGPLNLESAENFVVEVLSGEYHLRRVLREPILV